MKDLASARIGGPGAQGKMKCSRAISIVLLDRVPKQSCATLIQEFSNSRATTGFRSCFCKVYD